MLVRLLERWSKQGGTSENKKDELGRFFDVSSWIHCTVSARKLTGRDALPSQRYLINVGKDAFGLLRLLLPQVSYLRGCSCDAR